MSSATLRAVNNVVWSRGVIMQNGAAAENGMSAGYDFFTLECGIKMLSSNTSMCTMKNIKFVYIVPLYLLAPTRPHTKE